MDPQHRTGLTPPVIRIPTFIEGHFMKEPGLDGRHRDKAAPKKGEIQQKRGDTLNRNLPKPISQFRGGTKLETMRKVTGETSVEKVRRAAAKLRK
jgi:hypothetical protein